jgi:hypothetical protein
MADTAAFLNPTNSLCLSPHESVANHHQPICPHLSDDEVAEAEERLVAYVSIMIRIFDRMELDRSESGPLDR